jgi:N-acetylglucosamine kinase-like BadF-type ATPase
LLHSFYKPQWPRARVATLAKSVTRVAEEGDPLAAGILHQAAHQLAMLAASVRAQLWAKGETVRVTWAGGVFSSTMLLERFRTLIAIQDGMEGEPPRHGPALGALLLAYRAAGVQGGIDRTAWGHEFYVSGFL